MWLNKAITFLENILNINRNKNNYNYKQIFNLYQVYTSYFSNDKFNTFYHGPINNYLITDFKDIMNDLNIFEEENYIIKDNLKLGKDYSLMKEMDWKIIKELFGEPNLIKSKINNLEFLKIKALIFDKRIIKYNKLNYLKQKYIHIRKNYSIKDFKEKILRCFDYIFENKNNKKSIKNEEKNKFIHEKSQILVNSDKEIEKDINNDNEITGNKTDINNNKKDNNVNEIYNFNFYKLSKNKRHLLIEILTAYINNIPIYESINVEKIYLSNDNSLESLYNFYDKSKDILMIEIFEKNSNQFLCPKTKNENNLYQCSSCKNYVSLNNNFKCKKCHMSFYCS